MTPPTSDPGLVRLVAEQQRGVLATLRSNGRPQLSTVSYDFDPDAGVVSVSITADRAKYANLRRDPRASLHVSSADGWAYTVLEARAELSPVAADVGDATVDGLVALYRRIGGEHPDWSQYRQAMVADRRVLLRLAVERLYGIAPRD
jgi:PPOX class probable F420-dependent enzyme